MYSVSRLLRASVGVLLALRAAQPVRRSYPGSLVAVLLPGRELKRIAVLVAVLSLLSQGTLAASITTTFDSNNSFAGNMFDVTTFSNGLLITGLDVNIESGSTTISLYTRTGTYVGSESSAIGWTLRDSVLVTSAGEDNPTFVDIDDFILGPNSSFGFYVTNSAYSSNSIAMNYTNGNNTYSNSDLRLDLGIGKGDPDFIGLTFDPRTWNGTIYYELVTSSVPEPTNLALLAIGLAGLGFGRRKRA